jgi:hypothetical protein
VNKFLFNKLLAPIFTIFSFVLIYSVVLENIFWIDSRGNSDAYLIKLNSGVLSWGDHNFIFLITVTIASFASGVIAGAMVKKTNSILSVFCVIAIATFMFIYEQSFLFTHQVTSIVSFVSAMFASFVGSNLGVQIERLRSNGQKNTILGINLIHWIWILLPLSIAPTYLWGVNFVHTIFRFTSLWWTSEDALVRVASLICVVPMAAWAMIPVGVYSILVGNTYADRGPLVRSAAVIAILVLGGGIAIAVQIICYYIIQRFLL